jgi:hypothetical protein
LKRPDCSTPQIIEINAASIKSMNIFAGQVYPVWRNEKAILFIDEVHELAETGAGRQILTYLLTILERDPNPVRRVTYNDREMGEMELLFDFSEMGIILATTDPQKLPEPLLDRLTEISLSKYNNDELFEIFKNNLPKAIAVIDTMKDAVSKTFRGHPRDAVAKAEELKALADRCERESPSYALDCKIEHLCEPERAKQIGNARPYTTSLDATVRPDGADVFWRSGHDGEGPDPSLFRADVLLSDHARLFVGRARTEPMARRAAELRARAALSQTEAEEGKA